MNDNDLPADPFEILREGKYLVRRNNDLVAKMLLAKSRRDRRDLNLMAKEVRSASAA